MFVTQNKKERKVIQGLVTTSEKMYMFLLAHLLSVVVWILYAVLPIKRVLFLQWYGIDLLFAFCWMVGGIGAIILKIVLVIRNKYYQHSYRGIGIQAERINGKYEGDIDFYYDKVDALYLNSLDPVLRETILMRRDQEWQHKERMKAQQAYQNEMRREQENVRRIQEELLQIEREREERYRSL